MKLFIFAFLLTIPCLCKAQDDGRQPIKEGSVPYEYETSVGHKDGYYDYPWKAYDSTFRYIDESDGRVLAYLFSPDSFKEIHNLILGKVTSIDTIRKGRKDACLVVYTDATSYDSGGGTGEDAVAIIRLDTNLVLFNAVIGAMSETFYRPNIEAEYLTCTQQVTITDSKIILKKPKHSKELHLQSAGCCLTYETSQTFIYKNGKYQKYIPPKKKTAGK